MPPTRFYRPYYFDNLWGGLHGFDPTKPLYYLWDYGTRYAGFEKFVIPKPTDSLICADNRSLFGNVFCKPGSLPYRFQQRFADCFMMLFDRDTAAYLANAANWDEIYGVGADGYDSVRQYFPPFIEDFSIGGPYAVDFAPDPDYAIIELVMGATNWWGYHNGCYINPSGSVGQGCGNYVFNPPSMLLTAPGELRAWHPFFDGDSATIDQITIGPDPGAGDDGNEEWGVSPINANVLATAEIPNPDPTFLVPPGYAKATDNFEIEAPVSTSFNHVEFAPGYGGLIRPPTPGYRPSANSSNGHEAFDAFNDGAKELWHWSDAVSLIGEIEILPPGERWWQIAWGDSTAEQGSAYIAITPFWLIEPLEDEKHGSIAATPVANHIHRIRGGRVVHEGASVGL